MIVAVSPPCAGLAKISLAGYLSKSSHSVSRSSSR